MGGVFSKGSSGPDVSGLHNQIANLTNQLSGSQTVSSQLRAELEERKKALEATLARLSAVGEQVNVLASQNKGLERSLAAVSDQLAASEAKVREQLRPYELLLGFLAANPFKVRCNGKTILVSKKGSGKTTLLNLLGYLSAVPSDSLSDGTVCEESFFEYGDFLDTVGFDFSYLSMCRLFAIFLRDGFPQAMMVVGGRVLSLLPLFHLFLISDFYFCPLNADSLNIMYKNYCEEYQWYGTRAQFYSIMGAFIQKSFYSKDQASFSGIDGIHLFTHLDKVSPSVASFEGAMAMLADTASLPLLAADASPADVVRINIYTEYQKLLSYQGTLTDFINQPM